MSTLSSGGLIAGRFPGGTERLKRIASKKTVMCDCDVVHECESDGSKTFHSFEVFELMGCWRT